MVAGRSLLTIPARLVTQIIIVVLLGSAAYMALAHESHACVYLPPGHESLEEEVARSSFIFAGKVVAAHEVSNGKIFEFNVHTVWKGPLYETAYIRWRDPESIMHSCSDAHRQFSVGLTYLVFDDNHRSSRTGLLAFASEYIAKLGEGRTPEAGTSAPRPEILDRKPAWLIVVLAAAVLALPSGVAVYIGAQRRRSREQAIAEIQRQARVRTQGSRG